jgi:heterotetrameric sarcosine oxidase delta subunit
MLRLPCPYCGLRDHSEFRYGGDATRPRPGHDVTDAKAWHDFVFLFDNPKGAHKEYWQHVLGCRRWIVVERNTLTQDIAGSRPARDRQGSL